MSLSKATIGTLVDLIENKLATLQIDDRDDLREMVTLQRCLTEIQAFGDPASAYDTTGIPTRGRHRKMEALMDELIQERA